MIPRYIETGEKAQASNLGDKIGKLDDVRNDVALVVTKAAPIVIAIFTWDNQDERWNPDNAAEILIAKMAKRIVDEWAPAGK